MIAAQRKLCTFVIGNELFAVGVEHVQEVLREQELTVVPHAPAMVRGLINLRGQIVTAMDMRVRLGVQPRSPTEAIHVLLRTDHGLVSMMVDDVGDVLDLDESTFEAVPETTPQRFREIVSGVYKLKDRLVLALVVERAMSLQGN